MNFCVGTSITDGKARHESPGDLDERLTQRGFVPVRHLTTGGVADATADVRAVVAEEDDVAAGQDVHLVAERERPVPMPVRR